MSFTVSVPTAAIALPLRPARLLPRSLAATVKQTCENVADNFQLHDAEIGGAGAAPPPGSSDDEIGHHLYAFGLGAKNNPQGPACRAHAGPDQHRDREPDIVAGGKVRQYWRHQPSPDRPLVVAEGRSGGADFGWKPL